MAATRRKRRKKSAAPKRRRRRKVRAAVAAPRRRRRKKAAKVVRRRRKRHVKVEAKRTRRRRRKAAPAATPRRRRRRRVSAWKGDKAGHATAARKGHRRRKARKSPRRHRRRRKMSEATTVAAPRRRRHKRVHAVAARRHRRHSVRASRSGGMNATEMVLATLSGGFGFVLADGLDRFMATYNPSGATKPTDKFTSDGTGTLANTLNIAAMPGWKRAVAAVGVTAVPAVGAMFTKKNPYVRASLEGMAIGAGISGFKTLWANVIMPMLIGKDTSVPTLQKSYIARLYPAEVAASVNKAAHNSGGSAAGMLSGQADVGPFALSGDSPYPDAHEALGYKTGVHGDSPYPDAAQALRAGVSDDSQYPSAAQALRQMTGMGAPLPTGGPPSYMPGPPPGAGPGPQAKSDCGCVGDEQYVGFLGDAQEETSFVLPVN
jgi:hypothetical protein